MKLDRRQFMQVSGAVTAGLAVSRLGFDLKPVKAHASMIKTCQREAKRVNDLYHLIAGNPQLAPQIKIVAIGAGNSNYEVDFYRKTYDVPFP